MPTVDFACPDCRRRFERVVLRGEQDEPSACPGCGRLVFPATVGVDPLFDGIAGFSRLSKDTN